MSHTPFVALALGMLLPLAAQAQEEEQQQLPRGLFISQWICPQSAIQGISQNYDSLTVPIEQELVNEGLLEGAGMFFHRWGDEWNVNHYRAGQDRDGVFEAIAEVGRRFNERYPDSPNRFAECTAHRDNIYFYGPRTAPAPTPPMDQ